MHELKVTNGSRQLISSLLNVGEYFKTPSEILRAALLIDVIKHNSIPHEKAINSITKDTILTDELAKQIEEYNTFMDTETVVSVTEAQRELLKKVCTDFSNKIIINKHSVVLLKELGFTAD